MYARLALTPAPSWRRLATLGALLVSLSACGDDGNSPKDSTATDARSDTSSSPDVLNTTNRPPELERIGDRVVAVGQPLVIVVSARDADDDTLTWSIFGNLPDGARFDKAAHRFEWTPPRADETIYLTFVVSDGQEFDRETIRVSVVSELTANPPTFSPVGDRAIPVDQPFELRLVATDPDGDRVTYGFEGSLPAGAALDATTGIFTWTPGSDSVGAPTDITFTATDGFVSTQLAIRLVVDDGREGLARPPAFTMGKGITATVGEALNLTIEANDPNGDALTFAIVGTTPNGASVAGDKLRWTPATEDAGRAVAIILSATDGSFTAIHVVTITVQRPAAGACGTDTFEPNDLASAPAAITAGTHTAAICDSATEADVDYYTFNSTGNQRLDVRIEFDASLGDLDLYLLSTNEDLLAASEGSGSVERLTFTITSPGTFIIAVIGYTDVPLSVPYQLTVATGAATACIDDSFSGNHSPATAKAYSAAVEAASLSLCAERPDYWVVTPRCGQRIEALLDIQSAADLDMYLYDSTDFSGPSGTTAVAAAITENSLESLTLAAATRAAPHLLEIVSYPNNTTSSPYEIYVQMTGGCTEDARSNRTRATATAIGNGNTTGITCCADDWFALDLRATDSVFVEFSSTVGAVRVVGYGTDGTTQLDADGPVTANGLVLIEATTAGRYYLKVTGAPGAAYTLIVEIF